MISSLPEQGEYCKSFDIPGHPYLFPSVIDEAIQLLFIGRMNTIHPPFSAQPAEHLRDKTLSISHSSYDTSQIIALQ
jgi:hypothetical protein